MLARFRYLEVKCSGALTVVIVSHAPYLLIWGNDNHAAWGLPELVKEPPLGFRCVGNIVYVLLKDGIYRIDSKTRRHKKVSEEDEAMEGEVIQFVSGIDFSLTLKSDRFVYAKGNNRYG